MSWINDIENKVFTIITGDGKSWTPKWKNPVKSQEYNVTIFDFVNQEGSYVDRRKAKARRFELEFYFDGENAVTIGNNFEFSARDQRRWTIKHPFYGDIKGQPMAINQDNSFYNVSKFTCTFVETLLEGWPKIVSIVPDQIEIAQVNANTKQAQAFLNAGQVNKTALKSDVEMIDRTYSKAIKADNDLTKFKALVVNAITEIDNAEFDVLNAIRTVQEVINYPAKIIQSVEDRFNILKEALINLGDSIVNLLSGKHQYEALGGTVIAAMQVASSANITIDYQTKRKVLDQQAKLIAEYDTYMAKLDSLQTERADSDLSYTPNFDGINAVNEVIGLSVANLFNIAFSAKQEREFTCDVDTNAVLLTHRFYGLDQNDTNLNSFIAANNIGINELLNIRKGRKIVYYV